LTFQSASSPGGTGRAPRAGLDADDVRTAYRRWAGVYDTLFGGVSTWGRRAAVQAINALPGRRVLEAGVGTGLALPLYAPGKRVVGIDLSADMLKRARARVAEQRIGTVEALREMDAEATDFADGEFDIAVAMFVASVVPHPRRLLAELRRVVRPGGHILFVNHFAAERGPRWWVEHTLAPASRALGWHPDFRFEALFTKDELAAARLQPMPPLGLFTLVRLAA
jgi:phosphatidylethanolamine/phosphatidyl-N-methylethanolamine N-methyltransferase